MCASGRDRRDIRQTTPMKRTKHAEEPARTARSKPCAVGTDADAAGAESAAYSTAALMSAAGIGDCSARTLWPNQNRSPTKMTRQSRLPLGLTARLGVLQYIVVLTLSIAAQPNLVNVRGDFLTPLNCYTTSRGYDGYFSGRGFHVSLWPVRFSGELHCGLKISVPHSKTGPGSFSLTGLPVGPARGGEKPVGQSVQVNDQPFGQRVAKGKIDNPPLGSPADGAR